MAMFEADSKPDDSAGTVVKVDAKRMENNTELITENINKLHDAINKNLRQSLTDAKKIGKLLFEQKDIIKSQKGSFTQWAEDNLSFSVRTAQRYMQLYQFSTTLSRKQVKTITDAYAHIAGEPVSDEIVDANDSTVLPEAVVKGNMDLDELVLPAKEAKGLARKFVLTKGNIEGFIDGPLYNNCQGKFTKIIIQVKTENIQNIRINDFVCAGMKYLKRGGKLIFHKV